MNSRDYLAIRPEDLPAVTMRIRQWDDLVAEFGLTQEGDVNSFDSNGDQSRFSRDHKDLCGQEVRFKSGRLVSDSLGYAVYRWECEELIPDGGEFEPSDDDPMSLFG